jgi:hypothetical protein
MRKPGPLASVRGGDTEASNQSPEHQRQDPSTLSLTLHALRRLMPFHVSQYAG